MSDTFAQNEARDARGGRSWLAQAAVTAWTLGVLACGGAAGPATTRLVDTPAGDTHGYGAPKNTTYSAEVESQKDILRVFAFEHSECDKFKVKVVHRTEETVRDGEVMDRRSLGPVQIAGDTESVVPCRQRFANGVRVTLAVGSATHQLGSTNEYGEVSVNLSEELKQSLYAESAPPTATLIIGQQRLADVSLTQLRQHDDRVAELSVEFEALLDRPQTELTHAELARAFVLYEQLTELARRDARVSGLRSRYLELSYGRKQAEARDKFEKDAKALKSAKELLALAPHTPMFVQVALQQGTVQDDALYWAQAQLLRSLRETPTLCRQTITWDSLAAHSFPGQTQVALQLLRYAYAAPFVSRIQTVCSRLSR